MKIKNFAVFSAIALLFSSHAFGEGRLECRDPNEAEVGPVTTFVYEKIEGKVKVTSVSVRQCGEDGLCSNYEYPKNRIYTMSSKNRGLPFSRVAATRESGHFVVYALDFEKGGKINGQSISRPVTSPLTFIGDIECTLKPSSEPSR